MCACLKMVKETFRRANNGQPSEFNDERIQNTDTELRTK